MAVFLKWVVPPNLHPKFWSFFSRKKTMGLLGETHHSRNTPHISYIYIYHYIISYISYDIPLVGIPNLSFHNSIYREQGVLGLIRWFNSLVHQVLQEGEQGRGGKSIRNRFFGSHVGRFCGITPFVFLKDTFQGTNIFHLGKRNIIFKMPFLGDMLVPWRVIKDGE